MANVSCEIDHVTLENEDGQEIDGVRAICGLCEHETESFGTSSASVRRCLVLLREECPRGQRNYYVAEHGEDED